MGSFGIPPGAHAGVVCGLAWLGLQENPFGDTQKTEIALGFQIDPGGVPLDWWEVFTLSFHERAKLRRFLLGGKLIPVERLGWNTDLRQILGKPVGLLFASTQREDGTERPKLIGLSPLKPPRLPENVLLKPPAGDDWIVYDRAHPDAAMLAKLPPWLRAKADPTPPDPGNRPGNPQHAASFSMQAPPRPGAPPDPELDALFEKFAH